MTGMIRLATTSWLVALFPATIPVLCAQQSVAAPTLEQIRTEHQKILDGLNGKNADGKPLELDDAQVPALIKKGWNLAGTWAAAFFETHPAPSPRDLEQIFEGFTPKPQGVKSQYGDFLEYHEYSLTGSAVKIGTAVYVVEASYGVDFSTGTFMVVARNHAGHFRTLWNVKDLAEKHYARRDEIGRWAYLVRRAYYNGPLNARTIDRLPPAANGHARFLVDAYQAAEGGTTLAQLSMWEWNGARATPFLVKSYEHGADYRDFRFDGRTLRISTKERLQNFFSCGMCAEPRGVWTLRITPDGVEDQGHRFVEPELRWADELISKIQDGADTTHLAAAKVVTTLKARMKEMRDENISSGPSWASERISWGMLGECRVLRRGQSGVFDLGSDEGQLRFRYVLRHGKCYFTDVRIQ